jgi:hypothetical protein
MVFGEFSELSSDDLQNKIRLNALDKVQATMLSQPYPLVVAKPLVESQRAVQLLEQIENCKILWLYRSYLDVAASDLSKFGEHNGIDNIRSIVNREPGNWRAEYASPVVHQTLAQFYRANMKPLDAAALFWYARNSIYFDADLSQWLERGRVMLLPYEQLTDNALSSMQSVYNFVGKPFPGAKIVAEVDAESVGKGHEKINDISDEIRVVCESLLQKLDDAAGYTGQPRSFVQAADST